MKKIIIFLLLLSTITYATNVTIPLFDDGMLKLDLAKYDPYPAEAGKYVTIWINANNIGVKTIRNITFILEPKYPFILQDNDSERHYESIVRFGEIRLEYRLLVDKDAPNATSEINIKTKYYTDNDSLVFKENKFMITVVEGKKKEKADLRALFVDIEPIPYPLGTSKITLDIVNLDDGTAYHTLVKAETDIAEIKRNEIFVGNIEGDDFDSVDFELKFKNVSKGVYPLNITMIYKNIDGDEIVQNNVVYLNLITAEEAALLNKSDTPVWMYVIYALVIIVAFRALFVPFIRWFIKPFIKKK
ncbi:MAG: hypothetical protein QXD48_00230 [Candidatus Aenigmatarchaeota archaeon]